MQSDCRENAQPRKAKKPSRVQFRDRGRNSSATKNIDDLEQVDVVPDFRRLSNLLELDMEITRMCSNEAFEDGENEEESVEGGFDFIKNT